MASQNVCCIDNFPFDCCDGTRLGHILEEGLLVQPPLHPSWVALVRIQPSLSGFSVDLPAIPVQSEMIGKLVHGETSMRMLDNNKSPFSHAYGGVAFPFQLFEK